MFVKQKDKKFLIFTKEFYEKNFDDVGLFKNFIYKTVEYGMTVKELMDKIKENYNNDRDDITFRLDSQLNLEITLKIMDQTSIIPLDDLNFRDGFYGYSGLLRVLKKKVSFYYDRFFRSPLALLDFRIESIII